MKKILLACAGGFSTSMLARRMEDTAKAMGIEVEISAVGEDQAFEETAGHSDVAILILGPQIAHRLEAFQKETSVPVMVINSYDYGTMNGEKVFKEVMEKIGE